MYKIKALVLEVSGGVFEGSDWQALICRVDGKLLRFKVAVSKIKFADEDLDREITLVCDLDGSASRSVGLRVVSFEK